MNIQRILFILATIVGFMPLTYGMQQKRDVRSLLSKYHNPKTHKQRFNLLIKHVTPLSIAAMEDDAKQMHAILATAAQKDVDHDDAYGETALHYAAINGCSATVDALIQAKATVDLVDKQGNTPLCAAVLCKQATIAELLLKAKADIDHQSPQGTPLRIAVMKDSPELVALLVRNGAKGVEEALENAKKIQEKIAMKHGNEIIQILSSALKGQTQPEPKQESKAEKVSAQPTTPAHAEYQPAQQWVPPVVARTLDRLAFQANVIAGAYRHTPFSGALFRRGYKSVR